LFSNTKIVTLGKNPAGFIPLFSALDFFVYRAAIIENVVGHEALYFGADSDFSYKFEITAYTNNSMKLKLVESDFRFADHEKKYPLRTSVGTELTLERSIRA
jgi:hypothetical protein